jgi:hypothetical protein
MDVPQGAEEADGIDGDATSQCVGWKKGEQPKPPGLLRKRASFKAALDAGVTIISGSDVGVFTRQRARDRDDGRQRQPVNALKVAKDITAPHRVRFVMKDGTIYKQ